MSNGAEVKKNTPELLAPAGGIEQLRYALHFGADAIYCATDRFGLRQRAENFSLEDMSEVCAISHDSQAQVFVTCNAYMDSDDIKALPAYFESLEQSGVDGLIISDLGAFRLAKKHAPNVALHVSTQASCTNEEAALQWYELGAKRIVLAREMNLESIAALKQSIPDDLEVEVFVHGAMCMSVSGRCLISDYLTGRSANKGSCTQPCRWSYALEETSRPGEYFPVEEDARGTYIMNSKDLCMLEHLNDLTEIGVDSIKIEGRNKKAFYVATVVNAYRQVLDGADPADFMAELDTISHRPYSTGFFYGSAEQDSEVGEYEQRYDWVAEVLEHRPGERVQVVCRNRFYEDDALEVLSPHRPIRSIEVKDLHLEYADGNAQAASVANRAMEAYSFASSELLEPRDILRVKRKDPKHKN